MMDPATCLCGSSAKDCSFKEGPGNRALFFPQADSHFFGVSPHCEHRAGLTNLGITLRCACTMHAPSRTCGTVAYALGFRGAQCGSRSWSLAFCCSLQALGLCCLHSSRPSAVRARPTRGPSRSGGRATLSQRFWRPAWYSSPWGCSSGHLSLRRLRHHQHTPRARARHPVQKSMVPAPSSLIPSPEASPQRTRRLPATPMPTAWRSSRLTV